MQSLLDELQASIIAHLTKNNKLLTSPTMIRKSRDKYSICSGNFFFKESSDIQSATDEVAKVIENTIRSHIGSKGGEIIKNVIHGGEIWDADRKYFEVKAGVYFESYCFTCRTLTFVRVTWEKQLFAPEKEWLSIDVDEMQDPLWLEDP